MPKIKNIFFYILIILVLISCNKGYKKKQPEIQIYLTKEYIKNPKGIPVEEYYKNHPKYLELMYYYGNKDILVDPITEHLICCLDFKAQKSDLEKEPFITNEEINGFDFNNSSISLSKSAMEKILKLPNIRKQFVLCIDNKPELNGYFQVSPFEVYFIENYIFHYDYSKSKDSLKEKNYTFTMLYGKKYRKFDSINENNFYKALSKTDRIINNI